MKHLLQNLCVWFSGFALSFFGCANLHATSAGSQIQVTVTIQTSAGEPLEGLPVAITVAKGKPPMCDAKTDTLGTAVLAIDAASADRHVWVRYSYAERSTFSAQEQREMISRMNQLLERYAFDPAPQIDLQPNVFDYKVRITAWPSVALTTTIADEAGVEHNGTFLGPSGRIGGFEGGRVRPLKGIRQDTETWVYVTSYADWPASVIKPVHLSADQTAKDIDLGTTVVRRLPARVPINVTIVGDRQIRATDVYGYRSGVTFVSRDGSIIVSFEAEGGRKGAPQDEKPLALESKGGQPSLPPGEYFVAPGWFTANVDQTALISLALKGFNLNDTKISRVEVRDESSNEFTVNAFESHEAIQAAFAEGQKPVTDKAPAP